MWNHTGNILLHKDTVGKAKPPTSKLPPEDWVYGNHNRKPEKGVDASKFKFDLAPEVNSVVIHDWQYHRPTKKTVGGRNFTKTNKKALQNGLHTSSVLSFKHLCKLLTLF